MERYVCIVFHGFKTRQVCVDHSMTVGFSGSSVVKNLSVSAGDAGLIPGLRGTSGGGNGSPLQYSCLKIPMDSLQSRGATESQTRLSDSACTLCDYTIEKCSD